MNNRMYNLSALTELTSRIWTTDDENTVYVEIDDAKVIETYINNLGATVIVLSNGKKIVMY